MTGGGHWESAARQGMTAARAMLGLGSARPAAASFWSDLYDTRVHYLGDAPRADAATIDGDPARATSASPSPAPARRSPCCSSGARTTVPNARALLAA